MMYAVLCVIGVCLFNVFVWVVCDVLCNAVRPVLFFGVVRVFCVVFVYRRLDVLFVVDCVMLYGVFLLRCCA